MLIDFFNFIQTNSAALALLSAISAGLWTAFKFRYYLKDKRFETYHKLIESLVDEQGHADKVIKLDRQVAIVFELRNYPKYFDVTTRILNGLKKDWVQGNPRILEEINETLDYMSKGVIRRFFKKMYKKIW